MRLKTRFLIIIIASMAGLVAMGSFGLYTLRKSLLNERQAQISLLLDFASAQLEYFQKKEASGEMTREEAQRRASEALKAQKTKNNYFIVRDTASNVLLVHATEKRIGKVDPGSKMPDGRMVSEVYKEKIDASSDGKAYVMLAAVRPNSEDKTLHDKLNGATLFKPWGWMTIIGFFVDDVDEQFKAEARNLLIAGSILLALLAFLTFRPMRAINRALDDIRRTVLDVRDHNDFTHTITVRSNDEIGQIAGAFNELLKTLCATFGGIKGGVGEVFNASANLVTASSESAQASSLTSQTASSITSSVERMATSINQVANNAQSAAELAQKTGALSSEGGDVIANSVQEMHQIAKAIEQVSLAIGNLGQHSDRISSIVQVIKEVAEQTNLLALNAAIEAARAGESGRGFAVVADEVRKLAERTTKATAEISSMIGGIQDSSQSAVSAMQLTVTQVQAGRSMAEQAGSAIIEIRQAASDVAKIVEEIAGSIAEQSAESKSIVTQLEQVAQAAEENSSAAIGTSESAKHLEELATRMQAMAFKFAI